MEAKLLCKKRTDTGKNAAGRLRRDGLVPGNVISDGKSDPVTVPKADFQKLLAGGLRPSTMIDLNFESGGEGGRAFVKELQRDPVTGEPLHVDLYRVTPGRKVLVTVAVEHTGQSKGVKLGGALEHFIRTIKVKATPESLKDVVRVDITDLDVGDAVYMSDLGLPKDWELRMRGNPIVLKVAQSRMSRSVDDEPSAEAAAAPTEEKPAES